MRVPTVLMSTVPALVRAVVLTTMLAIAQPAFADFEPSGNVVATRVGANVVDFVLDRGAIVRVQAVDDDIIRVRVAPSGQFSTFVSPAIVAGGTTPPAAQIYDLADATYVVAPQIMFAAMKQPFRTYVWRPDGTIISADVDPAFGWDHSTGLVMTKKWAQPEEHYFGLGERGGPINRRGRQIAMKNVDNGAYGEFADPLYVSIPFLTNMVRGKAYGLFLDNPALPFFNLDHDHSGTIGFGAMKGDLDYYVMAGPTPRQVSHAYARLTGFPQLPPKWTLGFQQSRYGYLTQDEVLGVAAGLRFTRIPADVIYFDIDYMDAMQMFTWNSQTFPNPIQMNATLGQLGFHRVNIMEPLVLPSDRLWSYFGAQNFLLKGPNGQPLVNEIWAGFVSWFDFTNARARRWYMDYLKAFLTTGIDAVWNDLNEPAQNYMPEAIYDGDGTPRTDLEARNVFALIEARTSHDAQLELRPDTRPWSLSRAGYAGIQRYGANWGGDQASTWDAMRVSVQMQQSMAISGQNQYGHDVGGFLGSPDHELFIRWLELSSYTPLFRNHAMNTSAPREPWQFGDANLPIIREVINEHYRLMPYLYTAMAEASRTAMPALAPAFFHFPLDLSTYDQDYDFMLGPSLLVAPVLQEDATARTVYLPAGSDWFEASTDTRHAGGLDVTVNAPLGRIPVFVRAGAVIPKGPVLQHVDEAPVLDLNIHLYPGPTTTYTLYEDDGKSLQFRQNVFLRTEFAREDTTDGFAVTVSRRNDTAAPWGTPWTPPAGRHWWFEFHAVNGTPANVTVDGAPLAQAESEAALWGLDRGWAVAGARVIVRVPETASSSTIRIYR
jgi:alpha-glucosidase